MGVKKISVKYVLPVLLIIFFLIALFGYISADREWSFTINGDPSKSVNGTLYGTLKNDMKTYDGASGIPLEIFLAYYGVYPITDVSYNGMVINWSDAAYSADKDIPMLVEPNGSIFYKGKRVLPVNVNATVVDQPRVSTLDVAPSVLYALDAGGRDDLIHEKADRVVLFYLDAFGYERYMDAKQRGLIDNISSLGVPVKALCVYPSITQNNAKAMATGLAPNLSRGDFRSYLPYNDTIFDILERKGLDAVWVDGESVPVYVNNTVMSLDANGDGSADDEVTATAIAEYRKGADFMVVHYKDTDLAMHDHGPYSPEGLASVKQADAEVGEILKSLDNGTVIIIYADHGCHTADHGGNHGTLIPDDMYIPLIVGKV
jgi:hypothetical protein